MTSPREKREIPPLGPSSFNPERIHVLFIPRSVLCALGRIPSELSEGEESWKELEGGNHMGLCSSGWETSTRGEV